MIQINPQPPRYAVRKQKFILVDLFSWVISQFKKYNPSGNLTFNNLCLFQSLSMRILMEKILPLSFKQNFTPNTLSGYGLRVYAWERGKLTFLDSPTFRQVQQIAEITITLQSKVLTLIWGGKKESKICINVSVQWCEIGHSQSGCEANGTDDGRSAPLGHAAQRAHPNWPLFLSPSRDIYFE